jgi:hypothetical protein
MSVSNGPARRWAAISCRWTGSGCPGLLTGNPPPRWGAPGEDLAARKPAGSKRGTVCSLARQTGALKVGAIHE